MKNFPKDKSFLIGFTLCSFIIVGGNLFAVKLINSNGSWSGRIGFPLRFYRLMDDGTQIIYWGNLVGSLLFAVLFSFIVGLLFKFIWSKFQTNKLR